MNNPTSVGERAVKKIKDENGLKSNLMLASLYITAYELLKNSIIERIKSFFSLGETDSRGKLIPGKDYESQVISLDSNKNTLRASLQWLKNMDALNGQDLRDIRAITDHRNEIAHELPKILLDPDFEINIEYFVRMSELLRKIEVWWIINVELAISPELHNEDIKEEDIKTGTMIIFAYIIQTALSDFLPES